MKILIVGSKGFIGSHCMSFFSIKHEVWGCDVFTDYNESNFFLLDTLDPSYHSLFKAGDFDVCINCAGAASVPDSLKHPERDYELNTHLVFKLLNAIRQYNPGCKFLTISSAAVYGNPILLPVKEDHHLHPISPYGFHKRQAEDLCREFSLFFGVKSCSVRIFSAYGPGLRKQIFWDLYLKSKQLNQIELSGTGKETRDFVFVLDIIRAFDCIISNAQFKGECYNVGSGIQHSVEYISKAFFESINCEVDIKFTGMKRSGDPDYWQADISKLKGLGFEPNVSIEEGIKNYSAWLGSLPLA